ncbi:FAD-dependent oxidoreductase [Gordonibacter massiliensis (ex Traore et al. 2017)]|uniref:FAD-dependent oxidoreductase n=1 Tax=Gordonibacter massiliensis (ex Traore et al. 2017) TaxID=1841863 RepID=UPI001C8C27EC|nr:FAD-dependent oxidoreductase [Gordonibacter massiliensis (ex Traore et al. 2017)]MBX9035407.1 FAD-dependent oxidoreductase [Gordonibacter massiliensis (ex Traore et al. 2017)]
MSDFDVIVVGSGCAGAVAAYTAASAGKSVLVVERGSFAGAKNMTGGRIYSHSLKKVFPDFESEAPLERKITHERMAFMDPESQMAIDFTSPELAEEGRDSYSVLRAPFDQWLASKAEDAGAEYICGIAVEELIKDGAGRVVGVRAGEDEITAQVTILAEGCNTVLAERCLGNPRPKPSQMAVGVKQVFELPAGQIEDRFLVPEGEGAAMLFVGDCTHGNVGGGFLYTNRDSISLGLVATISTAADASNPHPVYQMLEDFKNHPAVAPIIKGAKLVEHSGHMVPEGGYGMVPKYVFDGCLVAGETAGLCMNMGYQVRGMDFAVASGQMAGQAAVEAIDKGDVSESGLASYKTAMEGSFVIQDLKTFSKWPHVMEGWSSMFTDYPVMVKEVFNAMFSVDGQPQRPLVKRMMPIVKKRGLFKLAREMRGAVKSL